jgi:hypothetical protein
VATKSVSFVRGKTWTVGSAGVSIWFSRRPESPSGFAFSCVRSISARLTAAAVSCARRGSVQRPLILMIPVPLNVATDVEQSGWPRIWRARRKVVDAVAASA